jgi:transposase
VPGCRWSCWSRGAKPATRRCSSRGSRGGRPPGFDADRHKDRNVVERGFNNTKQWRGTATGYDLLGV